MCNYTHQRHEQIPSFKCSSTCNISNFKELKRDEVSTLYLNENKYLNVLLDHLILEIVISKVCYVWSIEN